MDSRQILNCGFLFEQSYMMWWLSHALLRHPRRQGLRWSGAYAPVGCPVPSPKRARGQEAMTGMNVTSTTLSEWWWSLAGSPGLVCEARPDTDRLKKCPALLLLSWERCSNLDRVSSAKGVHLAEFSSEWQKTEKSTRMCARYREIPDIKFRWELGFGPIVQPRPSPIGNDASSTNLSHQQRKWVATYVLHQIHFCWVLDLFEQLNLYHF